MHNFEPQDAAPLLVAGGRSSHGSMFLHWRGVSGGFADSLTSSVTNVPVSNSPAGTYTFTIPASYGKVLYAFAVILADVATFGNAGDNGVTFGTPSITVNQATKVTTVVITTANTDNPPTLENIDASATLQLHFISER